MFYTCIGRRTYKIIRLKNVKRQSLSQRHPKREDVVAVTGDRRITKLEGRGPNPAICPAGYLNHNREERHLLDIRYLLSLCETRMIASSASMVVVVVVVVKKKGERVSMRRQ